MITYRGSPPRMRGKREFSVDTTGKKRITPAHAGKTGPNPIKRFCVQDHPRACGENLRARVRLLPILGSPPRMRGKRTLLPASTLHDRITPAHAGKTIAASNISPSVQDHPRACGENASVSFSGRMISGSPPRMRGKLAPRQYIIRNVRITPAHAGKTPVGIVSDGRPEDHPRACGEN